MIDYSLLKLVPAEESHYEFSYQITIAAYRHYIEEMWGWDEKAAREFHVQNWKNKRPKIILYDKQSIGTIYINENKDHIEIEQFILKSEFQNQGIGSYILKDIMNKADSSELTIKLMYLRQNPVASLYSRMGFQVVKDDDEFIWVERKPERSAK